MQEGEDVSGNAWRAVLSQIEGSRDGGDSQMDKVVSRQSPQ